MIVLFSFGNQVEAIYQYLYPGANGYIRYLILYLGGIVVASLPSYYRYHNDSSYSALGASGGTSGILFAAILFSPWSTLVIFPIPFPLPYVVAGVGYIIYSAWADKNSNDNIGHNAHLTGAIWGFLFTGMMNPKLFSNFLSVTLAGPGG